MKRIFLSFLCILLALPAMAKRLYPEATYQRMWCKKYNGIMEYKLADKARVDCLTDNYAVEFDFANKWAECIGQAIYYGRQTKRQPACVLIMENGEDDNKYLYRLRRAAYRKGVNLKTFTMKPKHICNPDVVPNCPHVKNR